MKKISFTIPCYNSEEYIERCINSLLVAKDDIEIIIVNDGSTDKTGKIANRYAKKYPDTIKVIHKENGGHGSGINAGLKAANGKYFKVVDSDDWLDQNALLKLVKKINSLAKEDQEPDLFICNYVYNHLYEKKQKVINFKNVFPTEEILEWEDMQNCKIGQYLLMHTLIYKTNILRKSKIKLPEHTFYIDNIVAYQPLPYVQSICYLDLNLYQYFIGREDQSVNEQVMIKRVDQQIQVTKNVFDCIDLMELKNNNPKLYKYLLHMLSMLMAISSVYLLMKGDEISYQKRIELWGYIRNKSPYIYKKLRYSYLAGLTYLPTKLGKLITITGYKIAKKIYKFN